VGYTAVVTYQIVDQFGNVIYGSALAGDVVTESVVTTSGPQITGGGTWSRSNGELSPNGTFVDLVSGNSGGGTSTTNQTFYINGVAVPVIGLGGALGGAPTTLHNTNSTRQVKINGTAPPRPCGSKDPLP
jgi:hypothetical protein